MASDSKKSHRWVKIIGSTLGVIAVLFIVLSFSVSKIVYDKQFPRYDRPDENVSAQLRYSDIAIDYPRLPVAFTSGKNTLQGHIYGVENTRGLVVVAHGLGGGSDSYLPHIKHFVDIGLRVFAYDCTGSYASEGKTTKGFPQSVVDLHAALTFIESQPDLSDLPLVLYGHSWGGYAVTNVLNYNHDIKGVISVAGVNNALDLIMEHGQILMGDSIITQLPFLWLYQRMLFGKVASFDAVTAINATNIPVLIIHGTEDELVAYNGSSLIAHREEIKNPYVDYLTVSTPGRNGHKNLFRTDTAIAYTENINTAYLTLFDSYDGQIPYEVNKSFYDDIDRIMLQKLEPKIMQVIDDFIETSLHKMSMI